MVRSARVLLESSLDYAGTFPPAGLPLAEAVAGYARALGGPYGWMLGRFVVPATSLEQMPPLIAGAQRPPAPAWELSVVLRTDAPDQLDPILWKDHFIAHDTLAESRRRSFRSFGSCSFDEPIEELTALHLL